MEVFVGTSGWMYDWNEGGSLDWYVESSGLNAVELNASFYRLPFRNQIASWARKGSSLRWAVKVNKYITHSAKLSEKGLAFWGKFLKAFEPMDNLIDFYLLQLPPSFAFKDENLKKLKKFISSTGIAERLAIEFREGSWFSLGSELCDILDGATLVSVDSPDAIFYASCGGSAYVRLHGRTYWYAHCYSDEELKEIAEKVKELSPKKAYIFFNNDHWMLENARKMLELLSG